MIAAAMQTENERGLPRELTDATEKLLAAAVDRGLGDRMLPTARMEQDNRDLKLEVDELKKQIQDLKREKETTDVVRERNKRLLTMLEHAARDPIGDHERADLIHTVAGMKEQAAVEGSDLHRRWVHPEPDS